MVAEPIAVTSETSSFLHSRAEGQTQQERMLYVCAAASVIQDQSHSFLIISDIMAVLCIYYVLGQALRHSEPIETKCYFYRFLFLGSPLPYGISSGSLTGSSSVQHKVIEVDCAFL
jgi:hypothetical protein